MPQFTRPCGRERAWQSLQQTGTYYYIGGFHCHIIDFFKSRPQSQDPKTQHDSAKQAEHNAEVANSKGTIFFSFLVADTQLYIRGFVRPSVRP